MGAARAYLAALHDVTSGLGALEAALEVLEVEAAQGDVVLARNYQLFAAAYACKSCNERKG